MYRLCLHAMPSKEYLKRQKKKAARKKWQENNRGKVAASKKRWRDKNSEKLAASMKRWQSKNPVKKAFLNKSWRERNPDKFLCSKKKWLQSHPDIAKRMRRMYREKNVSMFRVGVLKWYLKNAAKKKNYSSMLYRKNVLHELRLRKQRYQLNLLIDKRYFRGKNQALMKAGEKAIESKFVHAVVKSLREERKSASECELKFDADILVTKVMNARLQCVMCFKSAASRLSKCCEKFIEMANKSGPNCSLTEVCGEPYHSKAREPYFYESAYKVFSESAASIPMKLIEEKRLKTWKCDENKCVLPDDNEKCVSRLLSLCKKMANAKNLRRYLAGDLDKCRKNSNVGYLNLCMQ